MPRLARRCLFLLCCLVAALVASCQSSDVGDGDPFLVWSHTHPISAAATPPGFAVTPREIHRCIPDSGYPFNLYADATSYYLVSAGGRSAGTTSATSVRVRRDGIRISGTGRRDIEALDAARRQTWGHKFERPTELQRALARYR